MPVSEMPLKPSRGSSRWPSHCPSHWFTWLSPLCAIAGAWLIGVLALQGGFWVIVAVALACAVVPFVLMRLVRFWRHKIGASSRNG